MKKNKYIIARDHQCSDKEVVEIDEDIFSYNGKAKRAEAGRLGLIDNEDVEKLGTSTHIHIRLSGNKTLSHLPAWKIKLIESV